MSTDSTTNVYTFYISGESDWTLVFTDVGDGWSDETALAFGEMLNSFVYPDATFIQGVKQHNVLTTYNLDFTQSPPVFD